MATDVKIGGVLLNPQPSGVDPVPPEPKRTRTLDGAWESSPRAKGWRVRITYGDRRYAQPGAVANLRTRLGTIGTTTTIEWTDEAGATHNKTIHYDQEIHARIGVGDLTHSFTVEFAEAP